MGATARRRHAGMVVFALAAMLLPVLSGTASGAAGDEVPADDPARGLVYDGLRPGRGVGPCAGMFEVAGPAGAQPACTHGPDPAPPGVDVRSPFDPPAAGPDAAQSFTLPPFVCDGNGTDAYRVEALFVRATDTPDRYDVVESTLYHVLRQIDQNLNASALETGGSQHIRFVADSSCRPIITRVALSPGGDDSFSAMLSELRPMGFNRTDRKYFVFADSGVYCGVAELRDDESASAVPGANKNNGNLQVPGLVARIDRACWNPVAGIHELAHTLGGAQLGAPNATANHHCTDEWDALCYADAAGVVVQTVCPDTAHQLLLDCNHDDYFSTSPPPGSYLATNWNTSRSAFLTAVSVPAPPPNDNLANAQPVEGKVGRVRLFPTAGATKEAAEPNHAGEAGGASIWFRWTAPLSAQVTFDTVGSSFDTLLALYTGTSYGNMSFAAAADDGSRVAGRSRLTFPTVAGTTYRVAVDGKASATGTVHLLWNYPGIGVDFDGDGDTDRSVYRDGAWFAAGQPTAFLGTATDIPVPGDYDGDGDTDRAVFRDGTWFTDGQPTAFLGLGGDIPVPGDYDGDGDVDRAVFRPSIGGWYVDGSAPVFFGLADDIPVPADYDGDGDVDRAVFRPAVGGWHVENLSTVYLGLEGDIPVPGEHGVGRNAWRVVFRPSVGGWYFDIGAPPVFVGLPGDIPVPGDYTGDWIRELAVFRPSVGGWYVNGQPTSYLGLSGDIPTPLPQAVYRRFFGP